MKAVATAIQGLPSWGSPLGGREEKKQPSGSAGAGCFRHRWVGGMQVGEGCQAAWPLGLGGSMWQIQGPVVGTCLLFEGMTRGRSGWSRVASEEATGRRVRGCEGLCSAERTRAPTFTLSCRALRPLTCILRGPRAHAGLRLVLQGCAAQAAVLGLGRLLALWTLTVVQAGFAWCPGRLHR